MALSSSSEIALGESAAAGSQPLPGVLIVSYYFPPANFIGAARPFRYAKYLRRLGYPVSVVTAGHAPGLPGWNSVLRRPGDAPVKTAVRLAAALCAKVQRFLLPYNEQLPWLPHALSAAEETIRRRPPRIVYSTSPPLVPHLAALMLKWRHGLKWVADFRDPLVGNTCRVRKFAAGYDQALEHLIFANADVLTAVTDAAVDSWRVRYPRWASKFRVMWNGFDPDEAIRPLPVDGRPFKLMVHAGNMYAGRSPHRLLASIERLIRAGRLDPHALRLRFIGSVESDALPLDRPPAATLLALGCLDCRNEVVPREDAHRAIAESDYLLLLEAPDNTTTVPGKLFEYIPVGRPILALTAENSPVDRILARSGLPYACLYPADSESVTDAKVSKFFAMGSEPVTPSAWFQEEFDSSRQVSQLAALLNQLAER